MRCDRGSQEVVQVCTVYLFKRDRGSQQQCRCGKSKSVTGGVPVSQA